MRCLPLNRRQGRALGLLALGAGFAGALAGMFAFGGYRINSTPSYPLGLWRIAPLDRPVAAGDRVFICPPPGAAVDLGRARGYLSGGLCPSKSAPLIKAVAATGGQSVRITDKIVIDGQPLAASAVATRDAEGRPLVPWTGGIVPEGDVFLHSPFAGSYDSRYFGPLPAQGILGLAHEVLTFAP